MKGWKQWCYKFFFILCRYVYRVGEGEKNHHEMNNKLNGNHFANLPKNGANLHPSLRKSPVGEIEKEYYVWYL